ncbi:MAG: hypothetical protein GY751_18480 [Bacteroidetes bacterium]|nr:hypothetical protein [Bacteroidota bacterium]
MSVIIAQNQTAGALDLNELPVPNNQIPGSSNVTLTDYATVSEIQDDPELIALITAGSVLLNVDGITLTQAESLAAANPVIQSPSVYADYYDVGITTVGTSATTMGLDTSRQANAAFVLAADAVTVQTGGAGDYCFSYQVTFGDSDGTNRTAECWLEKDSGSGFSEITATRSVFSHWDEHALNTNNTAGRSAILTVANGDVFRIRGQASVAGYTTQAGGVSLQIFEIGSQGQPGAQGPAGSGSTITLEQSGSAVSGGPFDTLNFIGLSATDGGGGTADVEYTGEAAFANYYRAAAYTGITTTVSTLPFDTTRISNAAFTLNGAGTQLTINTASTYRVDFGCSPAESSNNDITADMWLELDSGGGFGEVPGTRARFFHDSNMEEGGNASFAILALSATDVLRVRAQVVDGSDQLDTLANSIRLSIQTIGKDGAAGATGPQGPAGSGSTIIIEDEGSNIPNTPHSELNFVGAGVTATDGGSGVATITIPGASSGANIAQYLRSSNQLISTTASPIIFDVSNFQDANYSRTGELITILTAGVYSISYSVYFDTVANARRTVDCWCDLSTNGGVSYAEIVPSRGASYARNNVDDTSNTSATFYVDLGVNDIVRLIADSTGTSGTATGIANRMWISLQFLRA